MCPRVEEVAPVAYLCLMDLPVDSISWVSKLVPSGCAWAASVSKYAFQVNTEGNYPFSKLRKFIPSPSCEVWMNSLHRGEGHEYGRDMHL